MQNQSAFVGACRLGSAGFLRCFFLLLVALMAWLPASSFASFQAPVGYSFPRSSYTGVEIQTTKYSSKQLACLASTINTLSYHPPTFSDPTCTAVHKSGGNNFVYSPNWYTSAYCPANSTLSGGQCTCTAPKVQNATNDGCIDPPPDPCVPDGVATIRNITVGYTRSPQAVFLPPILPNGDPAPSGYVGLPPPMMCIDQCSYTTGLPVGSYISDEPTATGLYRMSDDYSFTKASGSCSASPDDQFLLNPLVEVPPCKGFLGSVNGKLQCVATVPDSGVGGTGKSSKIGNPKSGSSSTDPGRIPSTGNGGNAGGPSTPNDGKVRMGDGSVIGSTSTTPTGTVATPEAGEEQAACGAPGQPKCGIDEAGTGNGKGAEAAGLTALGTSFGDLDATLGSITSTSGKDTGWGLVPQWLQSGACAPAVVLTLPPQVGSRQITIDLCPYLPMIYTLMNLLWVVWTFFATVGMVFAVTTAKGS